MKLRSFFIVGLSLILFISCTPAFAQISAKESDQLDFAQGLLSRGMYDMAILQYQKFIADYPQSPSLQEAYLSLGEGYFLSQDFNKAVDTYNQFIKLYPNSDQLPLSLLRLAQIDLQQQKYDDAIKQLTSIDVQNKLTGQMLQSFDFYLGKAYLGKEDAVSALDYFQKATLVQGATNYAAYAFEEMGTIYTQKGQYTESLDAYTKSMPLAPDDTLKGELSYKMAEVQFLAGKYSDAITGFQQVMEQYPNLGFAQDALANLLLADFNLGQYEQLIKEYQKNSKKIKDEESSFAIHLAAVLAYIELNQYDRANRLLDRMLAIPALKSQEQARIFIKKADILIRQKKYKDGLSLLDAYSSQNIDDADENFFLRAEANYGLGNFDRAFSFYENVNLNFPNSHYIKAAILGQAHARKETGRYKEAEVLFLKYVDVQDDPALKSDAMYDAVMMALQAEDMSGVISSAEEYIKLFPDGEKYGEVLLILADNYGKNNQPKKAVDLLQGYLVKPALVQRPNAAYFLLGYSQQLLGGNDDALAAYTQVDPNKNKGEFYVAALKNMAIIYLNEKKEDQAKIYFDRLISQPDSNDLQVKTYIWVCNQYLKEQKFNDVLRIANEAEKHFALKDLMEIKYFKAEALRGMGNCDEAFKNYDFVTASTDKNAYTGSAHIGYGLCLAQAHKFDESRVEYQKSLDENSDDFTITAHARFEIANVDAAQGNFSDALKFYLLVATIYDDEYFCSESLLRAAKIFEQQKRKDEAVKLYAEIVDKYKKSTAAVYANERLGALK